MHRHTGTIYMHTQRHMHKHIYRHTYAQPHIYAHTCTLRYTQTYIHRHPHRHTHNWPKTGSRAPFLAQLNCLLSKQVAVSLILQSLPRLFNTPGPQGVGAYQGKSKQRLCTVSPTGSVALISRRYGDRDWPPLGLGRWQERYT